MRRSRRDAREDLSLAVRCLPHHTRLPMLEGVRANDIIVGAYTDRKGGVCPMLAAHRCGGRTDFLAFAHAWDHFTNAKRARLATEPAVKNAKGAPLATGGEVKTLVSYLKASLAEHEGLAGDDLAGAIADHQAIAR